MPAADISSFNTLADLKSAPINPAWIIEGAPAARNCRVAGSSDHSAWTMLWDCTAGKFFWIYKVDETVHVLQGSVTVTVDGTVKTLRTGDIAFFRKLAFCQKPVPAMLGMPLRLVRRVLSQLCKGMHLVKGSLGEPLPQQDMGPQQGAGREAITSSRLRIRS
jgi:uncharacterized cupin superfamily protein